jgi:hypothetical protein
MNIPNANWICTGRAASWTVEGLEESRGYFFLREGGDLGVLVLLLPFDVLEEVELLSSVVTLE